MISVRGFVTSDFRWIMAAESVAQPESRTDQRLSARQAVTAIEEGSDLPTGMSVAERRAVALYIAEPTVHLTLTSGDMDRRTCTRQFQNLQKRLNRDRPSRNRSYVAVPACSVEGGGGYHIHSVQWDFILKSKLKQMADDLGFGTTEIRYIANKSPLDRFHMSCYPLKQHTSIFGSKKHLDNVPLPKSARYMLRPFRPTLEQYNPKLLSAMDAAESLTVSDWELTHAVHYFNAP